MKNLIIFFLCFFLVLPASAQFVREPESTVKTETIRSEVLNADRDYTIFLPKSYNANPDKKYPILYLLHGMLDTNKGWYERGSLKDVMDQLVASGEASEMIIVTPNAGGNIFEGVWNGYFDMPGWKYETFFYTEFLPHIEKTYRVIGDKKHRAIAGLSMGGGGSTSYAQHHSDLFCAVYAMSALMSMADTGTTPPQNADDKMYILGQSVIKNSCTQYVENADDKTKEQLRSIAWFIDCGDDDFLLDRNLEFIMAMHKANIPHQFRVRDGGHTWEYWHSALYTCLPFVSRTFGK